MKLSVQQLWEDDKTHVKEWRDEDNEDPLLKTLDGPMTPWSKIKSSFLFSLTGLWDNRVVTPRIVDQDAVFLIDRRRFDHANLLPDFRKDAQTVK